MDGLDIQCRPTERNPGRIALDRHFGSSHIHRVRPGSWKWYRAYYRRRVHHRFVLGVRLFIITHGMRTLTPNQPSAVGAVSSAVVVHAAAWPRRPAASLRGRFPSLNGGGTNLRDVSTSLNPAATSLNDGSTNRREATPPTSGATAPTSRSARPLRDENQLQNTRDLATWSAPSR